MLDRDPNADQPPDPSLLRARPRSHKPKNAPKKQPQRGLGVAQLEKLRLEEQSKQQEAVCLASLQHQNLHHHHGRHHHQEQFTSHFMHQHHPFQQQHLNQSSSLCFSRQIKLFEPPLDNSSFPLPAVNLNVAQTSLLPLTVMASRRQTPSLPLVIPQQPFGSEDEASLSPLSNVPDLCAGYVRPSSAESHLCPLVERSPPTPRVENPWLSHLYDRDSAKEKESTITFLSSASCSDSDTKLQSLDHGMTESPNVAISNLHGGNGNIPISMEKLYMQSEGTAVPLTELCLSGRPISAFDLHVPSSTRLEPPPASTASGGVQMRELSSFQTISLCPTWSPVDKVFNRKRSWACTQELVRQPESFKGVDLNVSVDEMESELREQDPNISMLLTIRDDFDLSPAQSPKKFSQNTVKALLADKACSECNLMKVDKALLADKACSECNLMKVDKALPDMCVNGSAFLSLRKRSLDYEKWEVETSGEFLTLGPSCPSLPMTTSEQRGVGNYNTCPLARKASENASSWLSRQGCVEQVMGAHFPAVSRVASNDDMIGLLQYKPNYYSAFLQRKDLFVLSKMGGYYSDAEGHSSCHRENGTDESLDLELRLSI